MDKTKDNGFTPLLIAAERGLPGVTRILLQDICDHTYKSCTVGSRSHHQEPTWYAHLFQERRTSRQNAEWWMAQMLSGHVLSIPGGTAGCNVFSLQHPPSTDPSRAIKNTVRGVRGDDRHPTGRRGHSVCGVFHQTCF